MALDAGTLTELVLVGGALAAAYVVPLVLTRRQDAGDEQRDAMSSWVKLNEALQAEIRRVTGEQDRQRADYQRQLDEARRRITELETEVAALQRALRGQGP